MTELKKRLSSAEILGYFDKDAKTLIITDARPVGLGAVLIQEQHGVLWQSFGRVSVFIYTYMGSNSSCTQTANR